MSTIAVTPERFTLVAYDADRIAEITRGLAERLQLTNPIVIEVDERTPLGKMSASVDSASSDATIRLQLESGALEDTKNLTNFSDTRAHLSLGRLLLRASDRLRDDFADAPPDRDLTNAQNTAWKVYCGGRLERLGLAPIQQQYRYDFRNRFGFRDDVDTLFDRLWASENLGWHDLPG
ncbi:hypothetical protein [Ilumatobacter nonamiensis]|uniref:hypothetical protein n=1 Tax=Ilumatobacter nonamiensis TaxID=467093 RepID=UPI00034D4225|nr:hypothetical protein [Ilumatobacter nonamiensis]